MSKQIVIPKLINVGIESLVDEKGWDFYLIPSINITKDSSEMIENEIYVIPEIKTYGFHITWLIYNFYIEFNFEI